MPAALAPAQPFKYIAGDPALDFVNTVDWTAAGPMNERLTDYHALLRWTAETQSLPRAVTDRLARAAAARPQEAQAALARAIRAREALRDVFVAVASAKRPGSGLRRLNPLIADAMGRLGVGDGLTWEWRDADQRLNAVLWPVVRSAAELLTSDEVGQIRRCAGPECGWMYVDRSRNGLRRWCQMSTCGTREKTRRRRA